MTWPALSCDCVSAAPIQSLSFAMADADADTAAVCGVAPGDEDGVVETGGIEVDAMGDAAGEGEAAEGGVCASAGSVKTRAAAAPKHCDRTRNFIALL